MTPECPPLALIQKVASVPYFVSDVGFTVFFILGVAGLMFIFWYFGIELIRQRRTARAWIAENALLIEQYLYVHELLQHLEKKTTICKNCGNDKMQLWNYQQKELLVIRCKSCKMNYTLTKGSNEQVPAILNEIEGVIELVNTLLVHRHQVLGKMLANKLKIDLEELETVSNPLEILCFTAKKREGVAFESAKSIFVIEPEMV